MEVRIIRVKGCESRFGYDPGLKGYGTCWCVRTMPLLWYCLCHRTVVAIVLSLLHLPCSLVSSCCLLYLRYRAVFAIVPSLLSCRLCFAMVLSLLRAVLVIVFLPSCFIVLSFSSCCFWYRIVFVMCCAVFGIGRAVQGSRCLCHRTERYLLICTLLSSFSLLLCDCSVLVIALSSASPLLFCPLVCPLVRSCGFNVFLCFFVPIRKCCSLPLRTP